MSTVTVEKPLSPVRRVYTNSWFQILMISFICFCCPGVSFWGHTSRMYQLLRLTDLVQMYNALSGLGGSGQVDPTVAANATVALLAATAGTALFVVGPIFDRVGPRVCLLIGGWTYALYSGSLLSFNRTLQTSF